MKKQRVIRSSIRTWFWTVAWLAGATQAILWSHGCRAVPHPVPLYSAPCGVLLEQPRLASGERVIYNTEGRYGFVYAPECHQARWVAYKLTASDLAGEGVGRATSFKVDPRIAAYGWVCATNADYTYSGYDRGHLLPSADRNRTVEENRATFLYSNVAPQSPELNQGPWKNLEEDVRRWTARCDTLYIVTGGVQLAAAHYPTIGSNQVSVPELFYKAILLRRGDIFESTAYVLPNQTTRKTDYRQHAVSLDSVERLTGLDLFPAVPLPLSPFEP